MPRCPKCKELCSRIPYEGVSVSQCGSCGGYWLTGAKLDRICAVREIQMPEAVQQRMMDIADESNSTEPLWCLACGREMVKEQFKYWPEIQIDRCTKCDSIWLDCGELEKCQIYWEYMEAHPEEWEGRDLIERKTLLDLQWKKRKQRLQDRWREGEEWTASHALDLWWAEALVRLFRR